MKIGIVTVTFNSANVWIDFINSIKNQSYQDFVLYIIDNDSKDETLSEVKEAKISQQVLIENSSNLGIAAANNQGIKLAINDGCEFVLLLNNDTVFESELLKKLLDAHCKYGSSMISPKMNYFDQPDIIWFAGGFYNYKKALLNYHRGQHQKDVNQYNKSDVIHYAPTCCALIHKTVFEDVGIMDEKYFVYFDDSDFFYRVLKDGRHEMRFVPDVHFLHKIGSLTQSRKNQFYSPFFIQQMTKNHVYFLRKQKNLLTSLLTIYLWFFVTIKFFLKSNYEKNWSTFILIQKSYFKGFKI